MSVTFRWSTEKKGRTLGRWDVEAEDVVSCDFFGSGKLRNPFVDCGP